MSVAKAALKAAKAALDAQQYDKAIEEAQKVLQNDSKHYHANVFLGLALDKQDKNEEAEKAYNVAASAKPGEALAWQGLLTLYEKQSNKKLDEYAKAVRSLGQIYSEAEDREKCQNVVDKYLAFAKQHGTRAQLRHAYDLQVPGSTLYDCLEGRVPKPDFTYMRITELIEAEEKETIAKLIAERRTRLGAKIGQVTLEVKREVYATSDLEALYQGIIDYTHDDELRRRFEEKLLQRAYDALSVLPAQEKEGKRDQVQGLAQGMVIIKSPFELAWRIELEWKDAEQMKDWDQSLLRQYTELLPDDGLGKVLRGFLKSEICPFPPAQNDNEKTLKTRMDEQQESRSDVANDPDERLYLMTEGLEESARSAMSQRIMAEYYLHLEEYESAVSAARKCQELVGQESKLTGLRFHNRKDGVNVALATALVHYQTPRHHKEARRIFEDILSRKPENVSALIGIGLILEEEEDFAGAADFLSQALQRNPTIHIRSEAAWCRALTGDLATSLQELGRCLEDLDQSHNLNKPLKAEVLYRIGYCMWHLDPSKAARKARTGPYARFLQCLQFDLNYAPAYTSLGIYYADYAKDKKRARKCFQKAFELSPSEVYAAERLASAFAAVSDWDLVETVAQRVVDSGKVRPPPGSKRKAISWPYAALGVCYLNNQEHIKAIPAFNAALRIDPQNYNCLVGLGESYHSSGRFVAATKVFEEARKYEDRIDPSEIWFARYMLGNVHRDLGDYEQAIANFSEVLEQRPSEYGVSIALLQTRVDAAWHDNSLGLFGRAADQAGKAIHLAKKIAESTPDSFNLWKSLGEACSIYASLGPYAKELPVEELISTLRIDAQEKPYSHVQEIDHVDLESLLSELDSAPANTNQAVKTAFYAAILAQKRGVSVSARDVHAQAVSWYNLGWAEHRAHTALVVEAANSGATEGAASTLFADPGPSDSAIRAGPYLRAAVRSFKRAIELEAGNGEFWNALGIITAPLNVRVAQHAFVRSLHLDERAAHVWTNLGVLYTLYGDVELARQAFVRAQSTDPAYALAWVGIGILALLDADGSKGTDSDEANAKAKSKVKAKQNRDAARAAFTHAFEIGDSTATLPKFLYATSMFDYISVNGYLKYNTATTTDTVGGSIQEEAVHLLQPLFALYQLRTQQPGNQVASQLLALFAERVGSYTVAVDTLKDISADLEAEYERTESDESLAHFAQAQADLARACLAAGDAQSAVEHATTALDLTEAEAKDYSYNKEGIDGERQENIIRCRLSAHLTSGLAYNRLGAYDESIVMFRESLAETGGDADVVCLLSQVLWAKGGAQEREMAREQLLGVVQTQLDHARTVVLLTAIALLDGDTETLSAISDDLRALRARRDLDDRLLLSIGALLGVLARLHPELVAADKDVAEQAEAGTYIMLAPFRPYGWAQMARVAGPETNTVPAQTALLTAMSAVPPHGNLNPDELSKAYAGTNDVAGAQIAAMLAPWSPTGWTALAGAVQS